MDAKSGKIFPRVGLILDCLTPHEYDDESLNYLNLQQYVIQLKRLSEHEAIRIFYSILSIVYSLHKVRFFSPFILLEANSNCVVAAFY